MKTRPVRPGTTRSRSRESRRCPSVRFTLKLRVIVLTRPLSFSVASTTQRQTPSLMPGKPTTLRILPGREPRR